MVLWSAARAGGVRLREWPAWDAAREASVADEVRRSAYEIIKRKGATNHAIGLVTADLLRSVLSGGTRVGSAASPGPPGPSDFGVTLVETRCAAYDEHQRLVSATVNPRSTPRPKEDETA